MKKMIRPSHFIFACLLTMLLACTNNKPETDKTQIPKGDPEIKDQDRNESEATIKADWRNPFMNPMGANIARVIRGFYLVGEFDKMLQFVVVPGCFEKEEMLHVLRKSKWGYDIKATNLKWQADSTFILTIKTSKQQTTGMEQYIGKIVNDTAKLILFPEKESLFPYYGDEVLEDPCQLKKNMDNIQFDFNTSNFLPSSKAALNKLVDFLVENSSYKAHFTGHTSNEGSATFNMKLSKERAKAIYDYLVKKGISKDRLSYEGKGALEPLYPNDSESNKSKNRRVEIKLVRMV
jgi:outer membrane protein OmpA-like peptidoglycan-associated protein